MKRKAGILMPVSALPSNQGIGDFGKHCYRIIDALSKQHVHIWQILPLNPVGYGNSPYQPFSSYAGDELYISVDTLADYGLLKQSSVRNYNKFSESVDYQGVREFKLPYLKKAYKTFKKYYGEYEQEYLAFCEKAFWLSNYAVFITLKKQNDMACWLDWPAEQRCWIQNHAYSLKNLEEQIQYEMFLQFIFYKQWNSIKQYANAHDIEIMGDIPFYVGVDSCDVWENQQDFLLDSDARPTVVAGVPPDYFSKTGQLWGNPIYHWKQLKKENYEFWIRRLAWNAEHFDLIRIDHFRAFDTYWVIPAQSTTAINGEWELGPAYEFFDVLFARLPDIHIVVEDLGELRKQVGKLRDYYHLTGMNVAQFEMEVKLLKRPRKENVIMYSSTHDNDTLEGYYQDLDANKKIALRRFFHNCGYDNRTFHELVIRYCLDSNAAMAIIPAQDILGLKKEGRMNLPGTIGSPNWEWKVKNLKEFYDLLPELGEWISSSNRA